MLSRGGQTPQAIFRGGTPVSAVYRGDTLVWSAGFRLSESGPLDRRVVPRGTWIAFSTWVAPYSMTVTVSIEGFAWESESSWEYTAIAHNGTIIGDEVANAGTFSRTFDVEACDEVAFMGKCTASGETYRTVVAGDWSATGTVPKDTTICVTSMQDFTERLGALNGGIPGYGSFPDWTGWTKPELEVSLNTTAMTNMNYMFFKSPLVVCPPMDTSNVTSMFRTFRGSDFTALPPLDMSQVSNTSQMFMNCYSLTSAPLYNVGESLNMGDTILTPASADVLMQGLKTVTGKTLTMPATAQGCDTSIATGKGWTVTGVTASPYPVSGTWGPSALAPGGAQYGGHKLTEGGTFTVTHTLTAAANGAQALVNIGGVFTTSAGTTSQNRTVTATTTVTLAPDDAVNFWAAGSGTASGTWSITKQ